MSSTTEYRLEMKIKHDPSPNSTQVTLRIPNDVLAELDTLLAEMPKNSAYPIQSRNELIRHVLAQYVGIGAGANIRRL